MKVFLLLGQSNMSGPHITRWEEKDDERLKGVYLLNAEDKWEEAKNPLNKYSTIKWQPDPGLNPGTTFAEEMKKAFPDEKIGIICNARGSSKVIEWQKGERYFNEAVRRAKACGEHIDGILWLQGEQDVPEKSDYTVYAERLSAFISDVRKALGDEEIPFIACEIWGDVSLAEEKYHEGIVEVNKHISEVIQSTPNCGWITSNGAEHTTEEPVHFAAEGMRTLGRRFAEKYLLMIK